MKKKSLIVLSITTLLALVFTILVKTFDLGVMEATGVVVGFSSANIPFALKFSFNSIFFNISEYLGYIAILTMGVFGVIGFCQLVKRKSLRKVDGDIYALFFTYISTLALYFFFDKVLVINLRPIYMPGEITLEPSFPSSHTLLAVVSFSTAVHQCMRIEKKGMRIALILLLSVLMTATVVGRLLSGVHWVTDIIGGVLWGEVLLSFFQLLSALFDKKR